MVVMWMELTSPQANTFGYIIVSTFRTHIYAVSMLTVPSTPPRHTSTCTLAHAHAHTQYNRPISLSRFSIDISICTDKGEIDTRYLSRVAFYLDISRSSEIDTRY